jgi:hypothetical protein
VRWSLGAQGREPRLAQRRVILFFWPMRASSANQISISSGATPLSRAISSRRAGNFMEWPAPPSGVVGSSAVQEEEWEWISLSLASIWARTFAAWSGSTHLARW